MDPGRRRRGGPFKSGCYESWTQRWSWRKQERLHPSFYIGNSKKHCHFRKMRSLFSGRSEVNMCIHTGWSEQTFWLPVWWRVIHANGIFMHPRISVVESSLRSAGIFYTVEMWIWAKAEPVMSKRVALILFWGTFYYINMQYKELDSTVGAAPEEASSVLSFHGWSHSFTPRSSERVRQIYLDKHPVGAVFFPFHPFLVRTLPGSCVSHQM